MSKPKYERRKGTKSQTEYPICEKCDKKNYGDCLKGTGNCFSCGKSDHKMRDCPNLKTQDNGSGQAQASGSSDVPKKKCFYSLRPRGEQ